MGTPRGRFAPSPTGRLHLGNARTALLCYLQAKAAGGECLLRIEDLDPGRSRAALTDDLLADLAYLGLRWDGPVLYQSQRTPLYREALDRLKAQERVYPCFCSRAEVMRAVAAPHGPGDEGPRYPGTCAQLSSAQISERARTRAPAWRFRAEGGATSFADLIRGPSSQDVAEVVGDFVVFRNDGVASYQLAVVVDDAATGITTVLRGDDLLSSTPRQLQLYRALGSPAPAFAHVPLVLGEDGRRLAKREGAFSVTDLRQRGVPAERVVALLGQWSGLTGRSLPELLAGFQLHKVVATPTVVHEPEVLRQLGLA